MKTVSITSAEYNLLMLCKGKDFKELEDFHQETSGVFIDYPEFLAFYKWRYWSSNDDVPYPVDELTSLFISKMSELLHKIDNNLLLSCVNDSFGISSLSSVTFYSKYDGKERIFECLRHYLRLRVGKSDYKIKDKK